jgi:hypothetical protein
LTKTLDLDETQPSRCEHLAGCVSDHRRGREALAALPKEQDARGPPGSGAFLPTIQIPAPSRGYVLEDTSRSAGMRKGEKEFHP